MPQSTEISLRAALSEARRQIERAKAEMTRLADVIAFSPNAIIRYRLDGRIEAWNPAAEQLFGYSAEEAIGNRSSILFPADRGGEEDAILSLIRAGETVRMDTVRLNKTGEPVEVSLSAAAIRETTGAIIGFTAVYRDISERMRHEAAMAASLEEKNTLLRVQEILLKEVNHRVKNSLQLVTSLLNLQAQRSENAETQSQLAEAIARVAAIGQVHERLYRTDKINAVEFAAYLRHLCDDVVSISEDSPTCRIDATPAELAVDRAIPLALIAVELLTNAVKHGTPRRGVDPIDVTFKTRPDGGVELAIRDYGPGLPPRPADPRIGAAGLSTTLISVLSRQLDAELRTENANPGTRWSVVVPPAPAGD